MRINVGSFDRVLRGLGGLGALAGALLAPLPVEWRVPLFAALGAYLLFTSLFGTCLGYRLMGMSTCPLNSE